VQIEVYQQTKAARPGRALLITALLLLAAIGLAARMTWARGGDALGRRVDLPEAECSLALPEGFVAGPVVKADEWSIQTVDGGASRWAPCSFAVWRAGPNPLADSRKEIISVFERLVSNTPHIDAAGIATRSDVQIGPYRAIELLDPAAGVVVRLIKTPDGWLAVTFSSDAPIHEWYATFDAVCYSVQLAS